MFRLTAAHVADPARHSTQYPCSPLPPYHSPLAHVFCHTQMPIIMSERNDYIKKRLNNFFCRLHVKCFLSRFSELELLQLYLQPGLLPTVFLYASLLSFLCLLLLFLLHLLPSLWLIVLAIATNASGITKQFCAIANGI